MKIDILLPFDLGTPLLRTDRRTVAEQTQKGESKNVHGSLVHMPKNEKPLAPPQENLF